MKTKRNSSVTLRGLICSFVLIGSLLSVSVLLSSSLILFSAKPAYGDGLTQETLSASFGNRKADLLIKMWPPLVTTETVQRHLFNLNYLIQIQIKVSNM
jgi:hypothetical protein